MVIILPGRVSSGVRLSVVAFAFDCASPLSRWAIMSRSGHSSLRVSALLRPLRVKSCFLEFFNLYRSIQIETQVVCTVFLCDSLHAWRAMYNPFEMRSSDQPQPSAQDAGTVLLAFVVGIGPI